MGEKRAQPLTPPKKRARACKYCSVISKDPSAVRDELIYCFSTLFPHSFHAIYTLFPRSFHALYTLFPRSFHVLVTLFPFLAYGPPTSSTEVSCKSVLLDGWLRVSVKAYGPSKSSTEVSCMSVLLDGWLQVTGRACGPSTS